ncbi:SH3-domain-containing protein [Gyrodon lividus]|nr:SH3-domain-containing protein [Gyrodon lividus]
MSELSSVFAHILSQTRQNVELLIVHNQISEVDGREILSRLSSAGHGSESSSVVALTKKAQRLSMSTAQNSAPIAPPKVEARAIWDWTSEDPNDLSFHAGEIIQIITETNADWWSGRNTSGKQGLFPSSYVEKLPQFPPRTISPISFPEFPKSKTSIDLRTGQAEPRYSSPPPKQYPSPAPPQQYPPPAGAPGYHPHPGPPLNVVYNSYMAPPSGPSAPQPVPQQQPPQKHKFGGLGQTMAQSAAGGVGFGAGAAIGGGLINSIF